MKTPICNVCMKSDVLCSNCEEKMENGEIDELDVKICRKLEDLGEEHGSLRDSEILEIHDTENVVIVVTAEGDGAKVVGRSGEIVKKLAEEIEKSIRVVEKSSSDREVIKGLLSPAEIESVNTVFTPQGEHKKVVVDEEYEGKINMSVDELEDIVEQITDTYYQISFE